MPRHNTRLDAPSAYVDGDFQTGTIASGSPIGIAEVQAVARGLAETLAAEGLSISGLAEQSRVDRSVIHDILAGRTYLNIVTLARIEHVLGCRLWPTQMFSHTP